MVVLHLFALRIPIVGVDDCLDRRLQLEVIDVAMMGIR